MDTDSPKPTELDDALYSRQLYVLGRDAMTKMKDACVLIVNCTGVALEIAKNVMLAGVKSVDLVDSTNVTLHDLSSQFFLSEADVGKPKVDVLAPKLAELNEYVTVGTHKAFPAAILGRFKVVVACDLTLNEQLDLNEQCRAKGICFIAVSSTGVFGSVFCDFGDAFVVIDTNGEPPLSALVTSITQDNPGVVTLLDDNPHNLEDGDHVVFRDIRGMTELNNAPSQPVKVIAPHVFSIGDTSGLSAYQGSGRVLQVKNPVTVAFKSLKDALASPEIVETDFAKLGRAQLLHACHQALNTFIATTSRRPLPGNKQDADQLVECVANLKQGQLSDAETAIVRLFAHNATGNLSPMAAFIGGISAQEVLKACTNKFMPIRQFVYFDAVEALPANLLELPESEFVAPQELARYQGQISVLGLNLQARLMNLRYFVVGAGAIGCEMLKNLALMGVGCGANGKITVTDMDKIERSNLNRQFLFRSWHLEQPKSTTAAKAAKEMNPALNITAYELKVGPETEDIFGDEFFDALDGVCNALDNVEARMYVDQRCVLFQKPLLESGTMGTKGNVQVVVPHLTESYGSSADPPEKGIPVCTLKHFPNKIEHTIQWARDEFEGLFTNQPADVNRYLSEPSFIQVVSTQRNTRQQIVDEIHKNLVDRPLSFEQCIVWARLRFEMLFNHSIRQLLHNFPLDTKDSTGNPFWSGAKQAPSPIEFDADCNLHMDFVIAAANLRAFNYGLQGNTNQSLFKSVLVGVAIPPFEPVEGLVIPVNDRELQQNRAGPSSSNSDTQFTSKVQMLPTVSSLAGFRLSPVKFEKDDDNNFHMAFITATSNLRANNYTIPLADFHETKRIAGKIIPAIATTTALVTGLTAFELMKLHQDHKLEIFKNGFVNLAIPLFAFSEPLAPPKVVSAGKTWTLWDKIFVDKGNITLKEFIEHFEEMVHLEVNMISYGRSILFSPFAPKKKLEERYPMTMTELAETISKQPVSKASKFLTLEVCCVDPNSGQEVELPTVRFKFRQ